MEGWRNYLLDALDDGVLGGQRQLLDVFDDDLFAGALDGAAEDQEEEEFHAGQTGFGIGIAAQSHRVGQPHQDQLPQHVLRWQR